MTTDEILLGFALILVLAVGSQVLARRLHIPALIVLLPVGFLAGALTDIVDPNRLLGAAFQPLVSLAVAVILYDAGVGLDLSKLKSRRIVVRLIALGVPVTFLLTALAAAPLLGMSRSAAVMLGAILVVSGPTVVDPLLEHIRPTGRLQRILAWEGTMVDPVGAVLGAVVFNVIVATRPELDGPVAQFLVSAVIGLIGGAVGVGVLWLLLRRLELGEVLGTVAQLAAVVAVAAVCDVVRDDTGLISAIVMGLAAANLPGFDIPARRPFFETLVQLILGLLFISISATVTPASLRHVVLPALVLVAILALVVRPVVAFLATVGSGLSTSERSFIGWMAPRGIIAAATASTFSTTLVQKGIGGADRILPAAFVVIVATVTLYGLTAAPVARRLGVTRPARSRPLLVGGDVFVVDLARALRSAGLDVLLWAGHEEERDRIRRAGLALAPGELLAAATEGAELEGVTTVLLLTREDDFNALASTVLADAIDGPIYRLAPPDDSHGVVALYTGGEVLFPAINRSDVDSRYADGAVVVPRPAGPLPPDQDLLFVVHANGKLVPSTAERPAHPTVGDTLVVMTAVRLRQQVTARAMTRPSTTNEIIDCNPIPYGIDDHKRR
jgi:NhaP-type Na+/H+ or K+/H+ antiporter